MMGINGLFLIYELIHIIKAAKIYMSDFTNFFDILRVALFIAFLLFEITNSVGVLTQQFILSALTIIVWIRGITYLRIFAKTRRLIRTA
mmetsp:Transcript_23772/g.3950  ORF Transcript_23772/g.3950 Transcript_23772/m.3950 type:complete len:89 (-) Transcript_23772:344-610(-)